MQYYTTSRFSFEEKNVDIVYFSLFKDLLSRMGFKRAVGDISPYRRHLTLLEFGNILQKSLAETDTAGLGIHYGAHLNMAAAGTVGQLLMSCSTVEQVFEKFLGYCQLLSLSLDVSVAHEGEQTRVFLDRVYCQRMSAPLQQFFTEAILSCWIHQARWLTGKQLNFRHLSIAYSRPDNWRLYEQTFGCEVEFDSTNHCAVVDQEFLREEVITRSDAVRQLKERDCNEALRRLEKKIPLRERIFSMLAGTAPNIPDMEFIAEKLNLSRSTLYRKLGNADTSYQQIVDDFRCRLAVNYLETTAMTLHEIADEMGFSDASNFRRAFKKWTGVAPSTIRQGLGAPLPQQTCSLFASVEPVRA